jgi:hypothetical protein
MCAGLLLLAALAACGEGKPPPSTSGAGAAATSPAGRATVTPVTEAPPTPHGMRLVGRHGVVVAVPDGWQTHLDLCGRVPDGAVIFADEKGPTYPCSPEPRPAASTLLVGSFTSSTVRPGAGRDLDLVTRVDGLEVLHDGGVCRSSALGPCTLTFGVAEHDVAFRVSYHGRGAEAFADAVLQSVRAVPDGWTTVPYLRYGTSVDDVRAVLAETGLEAAIPEVDFPHYATGTEPPAGSVVAEGSTVGVTIGDG